MKNELPVKFVEIKDNIYADFWSRLGAMILDILILLPVVILIFYVNGLGRTYYYYTIVPDVLLIIWFHIFLVKQYGGTPGKLILGIKIIKKDGSDVDFKAAFLRYVITFCSVLFSIVIMSLSLSIIDDSVFLSISFWHRGTYLKDLNPVLFKVHDWIDAIWIYSEYIILLTNPRKRSIHDFMAGTVVIKAKYHDQIKELQNKQINTSR